MRAPLGEPGGQCEQRRRPRPHAKEQARCRVARHGERAPQGAYHVKDVTGAAVSQPLGARLAGQEHELHGAAVVGPNVVDGDRRRRACRLRAADRDRDELAGLEPGGDGRGDHGHGHVGVDAARREHRAADLTGAAALSRSTLPFSRPSVPQSCSNPEISGDAMARQRPTFPEVCRPPASSPTLARLRRLVPDSSP